MWTFLSRSTLLIAMLGTGVVFVSAEGVFALASLPRATPGASAELESPQTNLDSPYLVAQLGFSVRQSRPARNRIGGIARGGQACSPDGTSAVKLQPIAPPTDPEAAMEGKINVEQTVSERPTVFVYVPQTVARQARFTVSVATDTPSGRTIEEVLYESTIAVPEQPGVVAIPLPALNEGLLYHWVLQLQCDPTGDRSGDALTDGWIQRVAPNSNLALRLNRATPRELPALYARSGFWQDTVTSLGALRAAAPDDAALRTDWISLLGSVKLEEISGAPLVFPQVEYSEVQW